MKNINFYGIHTANILLNKYPEAIINIYILASEKNNQRLNNLINEAQKHGLRVDYANKDQLNKLSDNDKHQGVIITCKPNLVFKTRDESELKQFYQSQFVDKTNKKAHILVLDEIQDPHNLGACIRTAEAMGVDCVITPERNSASVSSTVCKISAGAALLIPIFQVTNLARAIRWLKEQGVWFYGADMDGSSSLAKLNLTDSIGIVMGAEGSGLRQLTKDVCDEIFSIPMNGQTESLNVSVATGICLYEVTRQRQT